MCLTCRFLLRLIRDKRWQDEAAPRLQLLRQRRAWRSALDVQYFHSTTLYRGLDGADSIRFVQSGVCLATVCVAHMTSRLEHCVGGRRSGTAAFSDRRFFPGDLLSIQRSAIDRSIFEPRRPGV
jgi:hypothetical protein